ncbi:MAG: PLP-dependent aminotransferase family protein [Lachnospiraceae bacterium]|nr:PLP-dependent aminotransferase family protein [Lachnospiraceae bacterium]
MITYTFTNTGSDSLYEYLYKCIKNDILQGTIKAGEKLPSKRTFAKNLGISVITVENAYEQLIAEGYIYSIPKKGFYVTDLKKEVETEKKTVTREMVPITGGESGYFADFTSNQTQSELFPFTVWTRMIREVLGENQIQLMTNPPCGGIYPLREAIAKYLKEFRDMTVLPEQIIIGAGTEYLYGLLIQLLGREKVYAVENPGYRKIAKIYRSWKVACEYIDMDEEGVRIEELQRKQVDILHISPSHHYPTGIVMPVSRRYELLGWASKSSRHYIIEDDYDSELRLGGQPIPTMQSIDVSDRVIYMNTFTKTLASTVRISYMILPPPLLEQFYERLSFYSCSVSNFEQYTLGKFIEEGFFEKHINRLRNHYHKKRDALLTAIRNSRLGDCVCISGEEAGVHFLMEIQTEKEEEEFLAAAQARGIRLSPLSAHYHNQETERRNVYVMNYSSVETDNAQEIVRRLEKCI